MAPPPCLSITGRTALAVRADVEIDGGAKALLIQLHRPAHMRHADIIVQDVDAIKGIAGSCNCR